MQIWKPSFPGMGLLKTFFKVEGPIRTLKILYFYYYWYSYRLQRLSLDPNKQYFVNVNGYRLSIISNDKGISSELFMLNSHEPLTTSTISKILKPGMTCLDIGSNIGYYAFLEGKMVGDAGRIVAIEPSPVNFKCLESNMRLNNDTNISVHNFAAGDNDGQVRFVLSARSNHCRVVQDDEPQENLTSNRIISVPLKRVDSIVDELGLDKVDFVRMDTEGSEWNIYEGMKATLKKFRPLLVIEIHLIFLGNKRTMELMKKFKIDGYESKYYISRAIDRPIIARKRDIEVLNIDQLLDRLLKDNLPGVFTLILEKGKI